MSKNNCIKGKTFCLKTVIWTRKKQLCKPCHKSFTKLSKSFCRQLRKLYTKENLVNELFSIKTFSRHLMFSYGVFVDYLTKFRISFVSNSNIGGSWGFLIRKTCVSKESFFGHVEYTFGNPGEKFTSTFRYSFGKTPESKLIEVHFFRN